MDRRAFLRACGLAAAAVALHGCGRPREERSPAGGAAPVCGPKAASCTPIWTPPATAMPGTTTTSVTPLPPVASGGPIVVVNRAAWNASPADPKRLNPMNGISHLTVHHEGSPQPNTDTASSAVAATLRRIQSQHRTNRGYGDIGYHFAIDRAGRVWQGRDLRYQGAHVSQYNPNNIGVLVIGNFDVQSPTPEQLSSLERLSQSLMTTYRIPRSEYRSHGDLAKTRCPGSSLAPQVSAIRARLRC